MAWLTNWNRRKLITVNGSTAGNQSDYQMKLIVNQAGGTDSAGVVNLGGNVLTTFNDLIFTKSDGTTTLNYWIESITGITPNQTVTVWIKLAPSPDTIPTSPGTYNFYIYYGNSNASSGIDGSNTFQFFDDFASYSDNINGQGGWVVTTAGSSGATVSGGILDIYRDGTNNVYTTRNVGTLSTKFVYTILSNPQNFNSNKSFYSWESAQYTTTTNFWYERSDYVSAQRSASGEGLGVARLGTPTYGMYHKAEIFVDTTGPTITHKYYEDSNLISGTLTTTKTSATTYNRISLHIEGYNGVGHHYIDYIHIRKYVSPEPTFSSIGTEEMSGSLRITSTPSGALIYLALHNQTPVSTDVYTPDPVTNLSPGFYDIRLTRSDYTDWTFANAEIVSNMETQISTTMSTVANIRSTNIVQDFITTPCTVGSCTINVSATWTNNGDTPGSFTPSITIGSGTVAETYSSVQLAAGESVTRTFTVSGMTIGTWSICPNPN